MTGSSHHQRSPSETHRGSRRGLRRVTVPGSSSIADLLPYIPRPALDLARVAEVGHGAGPVAGGVEGTVVFGDISGFTKMSERLAHHGKVGAEEVADAINGCFEELLEIGYAAGGSLLKFGGDALFMLFTGDEHPHRAARAAVGMRAGLRRSGKLDTSAGRVVLRISMGIHSGKFDLLLVGGSHYELVVTGPDTSQVVELEGCASAGEIVMSQATARSLSTRCRGAAKGDGFLLRSPPGEGEEQAEYGAPDLSGIDLRRFLSADIRDHLLGGGLEPEHRAATVAFCHFDGSDEILERHGRDELARRLDAVVRRVQQAADENGVTFLGTDVDHDGGKILLVSGVPKRRGDDEERMLVTLRQVVSEELPLPLRIGVNGGGVFAGNIGIRHRRTFTVMGDTVNLAARLMAKAFPGQVLATGTVLDRCRLSFTTVALPPFTVKGKRHPITAYVVGPPHRGRRRSDLFPLAGDSEQLRQLEDDLASALAGPGRVADIVGEEGMGKSRLVHELGQRSERVRCLTTVCESYEAFTPYSTTSQLGRRILGLDADADDDEVAKRLESFLSSEMPELLPQMPLIATGLRLTAVDTPATRALAPQFRRQGVERWTARFLATAPERPPLLVVEDVHYMDEASTGVMGELVGELTSAGGMLCLTRRQADGGFRPPPAAHVRQVALSALSDDDAARALLEASGDKPMLPHEMHLLISRSMGNPLFLEELWRAWEAGASVDSLPDSVDAAVSAVIDRLLPSNRNLLRCASILGVSFSRRDLAAVVAPDGDAEEWTMSLPAALDEFLVLDTADVIRFRSPLVRECAYEGLPFRRRRELHLRAGESMVAMLGDAWADEAERLSLHFFHAQSFPEAWRYSLTAGDRARTKYANVEAATLYERALASARHLPTLSAAEVASVWESLGDVLDRSGRYAAAAVAYRRSRRMHEDDPAAQAKLCLKEAWMPERVGRFTDAVRWIRRGLRLIDELDGQRAGRLRAQLTSLHGAIRQAQGRSREAISWCERAVAEALSSDERSAHAHALFIMDWAWVTLGRFDLATHSAEALEIYRQLGDVAGEAVVLNNLGAFAYMRGEWDEALSLYARGRDARLVTGNDVDAASGTCNIGEILADQGHYDEGRRHLTDALRVWQAARYRYGSAYATMLLGRLAARTGSYPVAHDLLARAGKEFLDVGLATERKEAEFVRAECLVMEGRWTEALELVERFEADLQGTPARHVALLLRVKGYALMQSGELGRAREPLERSRRIALENRLDYELTLSMDALCQLARRTGEESVMETVATVEALAARLGIVALPQIPDRLLDPEQPRAGAVLAASVSRSGE